MPGAGEVLGQRVELLDVLLGQDAGAGGHLAHQRDVADGPGVHDHLGRRVVADLDGPGLGRVPPEVALALEHGEVGVDGGGGGEADRPHRSRGPTAGSRGRGPTRRCSRGSASAWCSVPGPWVPPLSVRRPVHRGCHTPVRTSVCMNVAPAVPEANICSKKPLTPNTCSWWDGHMTNTGSMNGHGRRPVARVSHPAPYNGGDGDDRKDLPMTALLTASLPEYLDDEPARPARPELRLVPAPRTGGPRLRPRLEPAAPVAGERVAPGPPPGLRRGATSAHPARDDGPGTGPPRPSAGRIRWRLPRHRIRRCGHRPPRDLHGPGRRHALDDRRADGPERATRGRSSPSWPPSSAPTRSSRASSSPSPEADPHDRWPADPHLMAGPGRPRVDRTDPRPGAL